MNRSGSGPSKGRVLVVDDYDDLAEVTCLLLETLGYEARPCHRGRDALDVMDELDPDVVILDIRLPDMNGYDVARALRSRAKGRSLHLIALTGLGRPEDRARAREAGFDQFAVKPLDLAALRGIMAQTRPHVPSTTVETAPA